MRVGVVKESYPGERRVALVPGVLASLSRGKLQCLIEAGAGEAAGFPDSAYADKGARVIEARSDVFAESDVIVQVRAYGANPEHGGRDLPKLRPGQIVVGFCEPLVETAAVAKLAATGAVVYAMELVPRITRAQSMDALSSQATVAGYRAVLLAADRLPKMFPMLMTAAGTIAPAHLLVMGAGVAGLQAISTARRLGAVVSGYDVRPAVKEQVQSLGARFVELPVETGAAEDSRGYARELSEETKQKQREHLAAVVAASDVVITTAAVPGRKAPILITEDMVRAMRPGSVIVDLAAERGGNCELTRPEETVIEHGVIVVGPVNLAATVPYHASEMYAKNVATFLLHLVKDGAPRIDADDEILRETLIARGGAVVHPRLAGAAGRERAPARPS